MLKHSRPVLLFVVTLVSCARSPSPEYAPEPSIAPPEAAPITQRVSLRPALSSPPHLSELSVRDKAAQLIMPWVGGEYWPADAEPMQEALRLAAEGVGGFVVGIGTSPYDLAAKFNALQRASRLPLLIAADLESGPSMRIRGGTAFPGNMAIGATGREMDARDVGRVIAREGRAVGIHIVFAPVVDVNNNPANPIINTRSYGEDPWRVGQLASAFIEGLREGGMLSTAKHFPGHGDTETDSHLALPVIRASRARLDSVELVPFRAAVRAGVDAVMSAHIALPMVETDSSPATLSALMLDTLLRGELGFSGLVVTDALNMGAIVNRYGAGAAAVRALRSGADLLLMPADPAAAIDALVRAVESGEVSRERLDSSVARVLDFKVRAGVFRRRFADLNAVGAAVGTREHLQLARDITQRSIVLVRDDRGLVPLGADQRSRVTVVAYNDEGSNGVGGSLVQELRAGGARVTVLRLWPASGPAAYDSVRQAVAQRGGPVVVVAASRPSAWRPDAIAIPDSLAALVTGFSAAGLPVIMASMGSPYVLSQLAGVPAYIVGWADNDLTERAVARALLGSAAITGRLPVSLPPLYVMGAGLMRSAIGGTNNSP